MRNTTKFCITFVAAFPVVAMIIWTINIVMAKQFVPERSYQQAWCAEQGGVPEYRLPDGTRCDCLTSTHAVEVEFAHKWAEAIGQSLFYSLQTGKRAGIVLILESADDYKFWIRLNTTIEYFRLPIDVWMEGEGATTR